MLIDKFNRPLDLLEFEAADGCSYSCSFCPYKEKSVSVRNLASEDFVAFISMLSILGLERVRLGGGEPLLRPDIVSLAKELSATRLKSVELATNGFLLADKMIADLSSGGISKIYLTMPSADSEKYYAITGHDCFEKVIENIRHTIAAGITTVLKVPLFGKINADDIASLHRLGAGLGAKLAFVQTGLVAGCTDLAQLVKSSAGMPDGEPIKISTFATRSCENCCRIWVSYDGKLRLCEGPDDGAIDLIDFFEGSPSQTDLVDLCTKVSLNKPMSSTTGCVDPGSRWNLRD